jgi:phage portal protein BeeE
MLSTEDVQKSTEEFSERFRKAAKEGGIVGLDSMEQYTPLNVTAYSANSSQMREIRQSLMRYWRVSEEILTSNFNEGQWQAFYESVIEPLLIQMGQAFTNACFTKTERDHGNRIIFSSSALLNASTQTKVVLIQAVKEIGMFSRNEMREMFGYHPVEGGDEYIYSLNYIKGSDMTEYQTGKKGENPDGQKPDGDQSGSDDQSI